MRIFLLVLALCAGSAATASAATDPLDCLSSVTIGPEAVGGFKFGAGLVYMQYHGVYSKNAFYVALTKRSGQSVVVPIVMDIFEVGATAALEVFFLQVKSIALTLPASAASERCVRPVDVFETYFGTGASIGGGVYISGEAEESRLWNPKGLSLHFGLGIGIGAIGAHASVLPIKFLRMRPALGWRQALRRAPGFFDAADVYELVSGKRDLKW